MSSTFQDLIQEIDIDPSINPLKNSLLQILYAITNSTSEMFNKIQADELLRIFSSYLTTAQQIEFSKHLNPFVFELSPWTKLSFELTSALSNLALNIPSIKDDVYKIFNSFLNNLDLNSLKSQLFLIGFIQGISKRREILSPNLVQKVLSFNSVNFLNRVEQITFSEEINLLDNFVSTGQEFNSLFFILLFDRLQVQYIKKIISAPQDSYLMDYMLKPGVGYIIDNKDKALIKMFIECQEQFDSYLDNVSDNVTSSNTERLEFTYMIRANAMELYTFGIATSVGDYDSLHTKIIQYFVTLSNSLDDQTTVALSMLKSNLIMNLCGASAVLSESDQANSLTIVRHFPTLIHKLIMDKSHVKRLTAAVIYCLRSLTKEDLTSLIYILTNLLSDNQQQLSNDFDSMADSSVLYKPDIFSPNIITAVLDLAKSSNDPSYNTLVFTLLADKLSPKNMEFNGILLEGITESVDSNNRKNILQFLKSFYESSSPLFNVDLWKKFSKSISERKDIELYTEYLSGLLGHICSKGDAGNLEQHRPEISVSEVANEIGLVLGPLAELLPTIDQPPNIPTSKGLIKKFQDMWFNLAVHGFAYGSQLFKTYETELVRIAHSSPPLASEITWNRSETSIEMNTILRRGTSKTTEKIHRETLKSFLNINTTDNKLSDSQLSRPGLMFLSSSLLVEFCRVRGGDCSTILDYLTDPSIHIAKLQTYVATLAQHCCQRYVQLLMEGDNSVFSGELLTLQLKKIFVSCCHRVEVLQNSAFSCADGILRAVPSGLCYTRSTFALLDILSLLFQSIIDADTNEYEPITEFKSRVSDVDLSLSDSYDWRQSTLDRFTKHSSNWVTRALTVAEYDMKIILRSYVNKADAFHRTVNYGVSFALDMASKILASDREFYQLQGVQSKRLNTTAGFLTQTPEISGSRLISYGFSDNDLILDKMDEKLANLKLQMAESPLSPEVHHLFSETMEDLSRVIISLKTDDVSYFECLVKLPFKLFNSYAIEHSINIWLNVMKCRKDHSLLVLNLILSEFKKSIHDGKGLYNKDNDLKNPKFDPMEYLPSNKKAVDKTSKKLSSSIKPHLLLIRFISSHFNATLFQSDHILKLFSDTIRYALVRLNSASLHPYSRMIRSELILLGSEIYVYYSKLKTSDTSDFLTVILDASLSWFVKPMTTPFGNNRLKIKADLELLKIISSKISHFKITSSSLNTAKKSILLWFLNDEISIIETWLSPLSSSHQRTINRLDESLLNYAYSINGKLAVNIVERCNQNGTISNNIKNQLRSLILKTPYEVADYHYAVSYIIDTGVFAIAFWAPASPVDAIKLFLPPFNRDNLVVQYAMRSIESFDIHQTFFYVPQIVQTMRHDSLGYIRRFILETANVSQLFAHQIIWNMAANSFKDEDSKIPDDIKPALDDIKHTMIKEFSGEDKSYFEKEFKFFEEVTGISGKLKPFIKKSKPEKKDKIDAEMAVIKVEEGVYLPSNPDGTVVDIDRKSGKPLQSHAKAPFLATFMIKKQTEEKEFEIVKTSAIFKVGDDCRQDVLALQLISVFRSIWMNYGVDVYVFPYRVTATAPGCGIIDVLPNSISRDMLGREAVNGLYEYFITQFGPETSVKFQRARNNFVKSLAAYSIITYLLAIKDRHNGNIMYDSDGHILHIDFGFCFDIVPGGVKFEQSPFKLTREMVRVMGGSTNTQAYKWFEELCVKCFLACRLHMDTIIDMVYPMLESGLPCFKPNTMKHLRQRFVPQKNEKEAAIYIRGLIKKSFESFATKGYDEFQRITNGIPY